MNRPDLPPVTFALLAYNQAGFVGAAVEAALAQDYPSLQVILSDDSSTDGTFEVMQRIAAQYRGPHDVVLNRNSENLNLAGHINAMVKLAKGELVVLAAGDDVSAPERASRLVDRWVSAGRPSAALYSDMAAMDAASDPIDLGRERVYSGVHAIEDMALGRIRVLGACAAYTMDVFSEFLPISAAVRHEDRVLPFRAMLLGGQVLFLDEKLVRYRAVGGMSRKRSTSKRDYLLSTLPAGTRRTLPDAIQRLVDVMVANGGNDALRHACETAIAGHEAVLDLSRSSVLGYERVMVKWLLRGASPLPLFKYYLKLRFSRVLG